MAENEFPKRPKHADAMARELFEKHGKTFHTTLAVAVDLAFGAGVRRHSSGADAANKDYDASLWSKALGESLAPLLRDAEQQGLDWSKEWARFNHSGSPPAVPELTEPGPSTGAPDA